MTEETCKDILRTWRHREFAQRTHDVHMPCPFLQLNSLGLDVVVQERHVEAAWWNVYRCSMQLAPVNDCMFLVSRGIERDN